MARERKAECSNDSQGLTAYDWKNICTTNRNIEKSGKEGETDTLRSKIHIDGAAHQADENDQQAL